MRGPSKIVLYTALTVAATALGGAAGAGVFLTAEGGRILPGVSVAGVRMGGLTRVQARTVLQEYDRAVVQRPVRLIVPDGTLVLRPRDFGLGMDVERTLDQAYAVGRRGSLSERWRSLRRLAASGVRVRPVLAGQPEVLHRYLVRVAAGLAKPPRNARFDPRSGQLTPEDEGREVLLAETQRRLRAALMDVRERRVALAVRTVRPAVTLAQLRRAGIRQVLSSFTTRFDPAETNRVSNIRLAAGAIDGTLLRPGEVLSFNRVVGPRTEARGYRPAPEIVRERYVTGIGGGICQVSSTLYNAALLAGLQVPERTAHSQPLGYVPPGRDATVYYDLIDLKVRNNRSRPVVVAASAEKDTLTIAFCGQQEDFPEVRLELGPLLPVEPGPEVVEVDPSLPPGERQVAEEARTGYRVRLLRRYYRAGEEVAAEVVSEDFYPPRPRRVKTGPPTTNPLLRKVQPASPARPGVDLSHFVLYN